MYHNYYIVWCNGCVSCRSFTPFGGPDSLSSWGTHIRMVGVITSVFSSQIPPLSKYDPSSPSSSHRSIIIILWHTISKWKTKSLQLQNARWDGNITRADKICDLFDMFTINNEYNSSLTQSSPQGIITLLSLSRSLSLSSVFLMFQFLFSSFFFFVRLLLRSGWIIILLAWQNCLFCLLFSFKNPISYHFFFVLDYQTGVDPLSSPSLSLPISVLYRFFTSFFLPSFAVRGRRLQLLPVLPLLDQPVWGAHVQAGWGRAASDRAQGEPPERGENSCNWMWTTRGHCMHRRQRRRQQVRVGNCRDSKKADPMLCDASRGVFTQPKAHLCTTHYAYSYSSSHLATLCPHEACPSLSVRLISKVGTVLGS